MCRRDTNCAELSELLSFSVSEIEKMIENSGTILDNHIHWNISIETGRVSRTILSCKLRNLNIYMTDDRKEAHIDHCAELHFGGGDAATHLEFDQCCFIADDIEVDYIKFISQGSINQDDIYIAFTNCDGAGEFQFIGR